MAKPRSAATYGYDDGGELSISLSSSQMRRSRVNVHSTAQKTPEILIEGERATHPLHNMASADQAPPRSHDKIKTDQRIGQYNIIKTLGEGSFGKVKLAVHRSTGQQVALKIISRKKLISRDMAGRVEREIEYLQLLRHPHIIKL